MPGVKQHDNAPNRSKGIAKSDCKAARLGLLLKICDTVRYDNETIQTKASHDFDSRDATLIMPTIE